MAMRKTALALLALQSPILGAVAGEVQDGRCGGTADEKYICGPANAEDLVVIPGTNWILASRMANSADREGMFYLLDASDHSWRKLDIDAIAEARDKTLYPDCPGKPTSALQRGHGIALDARNGALKLLAINHGGRESVEIFTVTKNEGAEPSLAWAGCVVAPQGAMLNSVAALPEGGFAVTKFFDTTNKNWGEDLFAGKETGEVLEWSPKDGWSPVPGTKMSGPNGIALSPDAGAYFIAEWGGGKLHKVSRKTGERQSIDTGMHADNLQWDAEGRLLVAGQFFDDPMAYRSCHMSEAPVCAFPFKVLRVDPTTLASETLVSEGEPKEFGSGTTALEVGDEYWIGTSRGDRIARIPKP
ncbi:hypothetical protein SAMN04488498_10199 [Mesorhizobium albiziae]|uniref:SMP-30/Gluconolactonase/LRE-like region domain-containing protein n=1 Tax=Neomesorhizobium albiziae TaxID=335020 RepID=A0A1I3UZB3_9HYPH|nr:hypothetical protein [Mesorhizobium albiziae]GLS28560.1 hypothetical protein GCM10007937_02670 [Mesorhizobium albiziae]SFJ88295.1 hypothetical protein SAMN04488498_10199 [Mesorhizobium albiziae]